MNWGKCNSCGQYAWLPHGCQSFSVEQDWSHKNDGSGYEEAGTAHGMDAEDAAENWAEEDDAGGDYTIIGGSPARIRLTSPKGEVTEFVVEGESVPRYTAREVESGSD